MNSPVIFTVVDTQYLYTKGKDNSSLSAEQKFVTFLSSDISVAGNRGGLPYLSSKQNLQVPLKASPGSLM